MSMLGKLMRTRFFFLFFIALAALTACSGTNPKPTRVSMHSFEVKQGQFFLDDKPFQIISGEMHYPRIPHQYWRARMQAAKAMGLNTITAYVFWNVHEEKPGEYDFSGDKNVAEFIREAQAEGLYVILRPGPYVCAEWEFGGFPAWLLKDKNLIIRSNDTAYMNAVKRWFKALGKQLSSLQLAHGGPIIAIQVENEYGSFGSDQNYMKAVQQALIDSGFEDTLLYTADGADDLKNGMLADLPAVVNFGAGKTTKAFTKLHAARLAGPSMAGEYWVGWFDAWGKKHNSSPVEQTKADLEWMLSKGFSVSLYMFHGGTSFGFMNGANSEEGDYQPYVSSYDYDSPLNESGRITEKFKAFREVITKATGHKPAAFPELAPPISIPSFTANESVSLWDFLPEPILSKDPLSMEEVDQAYGWILYRTKIGKGHAELALEGLNDYAQVYVNKTLVGTLDRRLKEHTLALDISKENSTLDILLQNSGRINYSVSLRGEHKGIRAARLAGKSLENWEIFPLPMHNIESLPYHRATCTGPCFYRAHFHLHEIADTFLDTRALGKGMLWLNGRALGRFWKIGPQGTLYAPAPWLKKGENTIHYFDLEGKTGAQLKGLETPILDSAK